MIVPESHARDVSPSDSVTHPTVFAKRGADSFVEGVFRSGASDCKPEVSVLVKEFLFRRPAFADPEGGSPVSVVPAGGTESRDDLLTHLTPPSSGDVELAMP